MSTPEKTQVVCRQCGKEFETVIWDSVSSDMPDVADKIMDGTFFRVPCPECGETVDLDYYMLYTDLYRGYMIYYMEGALDEDMEHFGGAAKAGCRVRVVNSREALREKVMIFNAGYDDRIIELIKVVLTIQLADMVTGDDKNLEQIYFCWQDEGPHRFHMILEDGTVFYYNLTNDYYDSVASSLAPALEKYGEQLVIDRDWATDFVDAMS